MRTGVFSAAALGRTPRHLQNLRGGCDCSGARAAKSCDADPRFCPRSAGRTPARAQDSHATRRLRSDAELMARTFGGSGLILLKQGTGDPPETYRLEYFVKGLERGRGGKPVIRENHLVEIQLNSDYPRLSPHCKMLTPIFHPNIDASAICVGDHWTAGERLVDLAVRIGEMIAYQAYNIKSPLDGEAAMWADLHAEELPVDTRPLRPTID